MACAQFVIAGRVDCVRYAQLEEAANQLQARLPSCRVYKQPQTADHWPCFLRRTCLQQGWNLPADPEAPLVWRALVQRGGRGLLIGGLSEFLQLASVYYGIRLRPLDDKQARPAAAETARQQVQQCAQRRHERAALERRLTCVCVVGAASQAAQHFLVALATGRVLGASTLLRLQIHGDPRQPELTALRYQLLDLASEQLCQVILLPSLTEAARNAAVVVILDPILNRQPPEPTPSPSHPATPPAQPRSTDVSDDEITAAMRPGSPEPSDVSPQPAISVTPTPERSPPPAPREMPESTPPTSSRFASAESRRLSTIQEDPDSEALEEEEMAALAMSRPTSGRSWLASGMTSGLARSQEPTVDAAEREPATGGLVVAAAAAVAAEAEQAQTESAVQPPTPAAAGAETTPAVAGDAATAVPATTGEEQDTIPTDGAKAPSQPEPESVTEAAAEAAAGDAAVPASTPSLETAASEQVCDVTDEEVAELFRRMRDCALAISAAASSYCRVVVAGGRLPCFAATVVLLHTSRLPPANVIALCQPRVNQLRALLARQLGVTATDIHGLVEWGCPPAGRRWLDVEAISVSGHTGAIRGPPGYRRPLPEVLHQHQWLQQQLPTELAERAGSRLLQDGAEVSALTLATSLTDTLRRWWAGHDDNTERSLGVATDGGVPGVPARLVLAAPARLSAGDFRQTRAAPASPVGVAHVRSAAAQTVHWLQQCGVSVSPSGQRCTISTCASSVYGSEPPVLTDSEPPPATPDGDGPPLAEQERRPSTARGVRTPSATSATSATGADKPHEAGQGDSEASRAAETQGPEPAAVATEEAEAEAETEEPTPSSRQGSTASQRRGSSASRPITAEAETEEPTASRPITAEADRGAAIFTN